MPLTIANIASAMSRQFPHVKMKLKQAGMQDTVDEFMRKVLITSIYGSIGITLAFGMLLTGFGMSIAIFLFLLPVSFSLLFAYMMKTPEVYIGRRKTEIDREIIFMGRYLILELEAGIPIYSAMKNVVTSYEHIGKHFREIINRVDTGTPMEDALNEAILTSPSTNMVRILWQLLNALKTGSDVTISLSNVIDQITREQVILLKEYGKKLNPMAMMYMVVAIIFPSLGVTIFLVMSSFFALDITMTWLVVIAVGIGFLQFMFYSMIKSARPAVEV